MVQLGLTADFKRQLLQWYGATVHMKEPRHVLGKFDLTKRNMREVVMQIAEPASTKEATERMLKILDSTYANSDLNLLADNPRHMNSEERIMLLSHLGDFEDFFMVL